MEEQFPFQINKQKIFGSIVAAAVGIIVLLGALMVMHREQSGTPEIYPTRDNSIEAVQNLNGENP